MVYQPYIHPELLNECPKDYTGRRKPYDPDSPRYIFNPNTLHIPTGSTIFTFLTQAEGAASDYDLTMPNFSDFSSDDDESQNQDLTPTFCESNEENSDVELDIDSDINIPDRKHV